MKTIKIFMAAAVSIIMIAGCNVNDPIYETAHPNHSKITLTMDWSATNIATSPPAECAVRVGACSETITVVSKTLDYLFEPGDYTIYINNTAEGIVVNGTTVTAAYTSGMLGWLYTGLQTVIVERDTDHEFTVAMAQQVRELTLVIEPTGGTIERIAGITGTLSGVAGSLDFATGTHGSPSTVALTFTKDTDGKWKAAVRLLGITGTEQKLSSTITFTDGTPNQPMESDLNTALADFNADKKTPLTLSGMMIETPTEVGFTATITDWNPVSGGDVIAD